MENEMSSSVLLDYICRPSKGDDFLSEANNKYNEKNRLKWEIFIGKVKRNRVAFNFNFPVLCLGLFLWGGIFGGLWFAARGRLWFGAFIWPTIVVVTTFSIVLMIMSIQWFFVSRTPSMTWLASLIIFGRIISQFALSLFANYIYLKWAMKQVKVKGGEVLNWKRSQVKNVCIAFVILMLLLGLLDLAKWPGTPPGIFWF